ncbi:hypothetical protein GCM10025865_24990 [Paraoerskovia sediminicola]|uniref:Acyltransferase 3 domain-containing protein n=1 Tax=Paraoerskovia sediminicola TaxID=1138587 RepID=A0ABM8G4X1_9CELL|nr:acyltransferase [Paraoerskovia sediminicola]BDZ43200.1 hypothetical protein GCM10025865_24990 [Paraoerskovia sediminicola]
MTTQVQARPARIARIARRSTDRILGLDALRAVAVVAVVAYHLVPGALPGGYIGVDVFFVVSGFLITTLLVRERRRKGHVSLTGFWTRRARRILPALGLTVLVCTAAAALIGGDVLVGIARQLIGAATFTSNWADIAAGASYSAGLTPTLFANLWSLAVEEQFYLLWPLCAAALVATTTRLRSRVPMAVAGTLALASALTMAVLYVPGSDPSRVYLGTDTHAFGLMLGALLAFARERRAATRGPRPPVVVRASRRLVRWVLGLAGAAALGWAAWTMAWDSTVTYRGGLVAVSVATVAVINLLAGEQRLGGMIDRGPVRWIGVRSYGIYLWHWPVFVLVATVAGGQEHLASPGWGVVAVTSLITVVASSWSYRYVERPVMTLGYRGACRQLGRWMAATRERAGAREVALRRSSTVLAVVATVAALVALGVLRAPAQTVAAAQIAEGERIAAATLAADQAQAAEDAAAAEAEAAAAAAAEKLAAAQGKKDKAAAEKAAAEKAAADKVAAEKAEKAKKAAEKKASKEKASKEESGEAKARRAARR